MSEWLGTGLQNRSQRFESAWHLNPDPSRGRDFLYSGISSSIRPGLTYNTGTASSHPPVRAVLECGPLSESLKGNYFTIILTAEFPAFTTYTPG